MMDNFLTVAGQVGVLFALMGVGAVCRKTRWIDDASIKGMVNLLLLIVTPCLMVDVFQRPFDLAMMRSFAVAFAMAFAVHFVLISISSVVFRRTGRDTQAVLKVATVFSNAGFMGIPLEQAILGDRGVFFGVVYVVVFNLLMWSWGLSKMGGKANRRMMLVNPGTVGVALGLPLFLLSVRLPSAVGTPVSLLADLNTPLAMIVTGYYLFGAKLSKVASAPAAYLSAALRLVACPLLLTLAILPFKASLDREMMLALVIPASAPAAAMVTMFASKYARDVDMSVGLVCGTTLLSIVTMPAMIALAMELLS
jgi:predicted permease